MERAWRIGELAEATGLTVRTLHHYDEIGLLRPAGRTAAGHRLYRRNDVDLLYRILALKGLGFRLGQIETCLNGEGLDLRAAVRRQLEQVEGQIEIQQGLRRRLTRILGVLDGAQVPSSEQLIETMEVVTRMEKYYTPEQQAQLEERRRELGDEGMKRAERQWADLIAAVEAERAAGTDPSDPKVQKLGAEWADLIEQFTGGDPGIRSSLQKMYEKEGVERASRGMVHPELMAYMAQVNEARKS